MAIPYKFTPKSIAEYEEKNESILDILNPGAVKISTIADFVVIGLETNIDKAYALIDDELKSGKDVYDLFEELLHALRDQGFLPRDLQVEDFPTLLKAPILAINEQLKELRRQLEIVLEGTNTTTSETTDSQGIEETDEL